jgi:hypothetical protein
MGDHEQALEEQRAVAASAKDRPGLARTYVAVLNDLAVTLRDAGRCDESRRQHATAVSEAVRRLGREDRQTLAVRNEALALLEGAGAIEQQRAVVEALSVAHGPHQPTTIVAKQNLLRLRSVEESGPAFVAELVALVDQAREHLGAVHPTTLSVENDLLGARRTRGDRLVAEGRDLVARTESALGESHGHLLAARTTLAMILYDDGRLAEAEALLESVVRRSEALRGPEGLLAERRARLDRMRAERTGPE